MPPAAAQFCAFIQELAQAALGEPDLMVALPAADWDYDYAAYAATCDAIILMNYDQHWLTSRPGPSPPGLFTSTWPTSPRSCRRQAGYCIANYGYDWAELPATPRTIAQSASRNHWSPRRSRKLKWNSTAIR